MSAADRAWLRLHRVALAEFDLRVRQIPPDHWAASTPCEEWDVYDLVRHNTAENRWATALLAGAVGDDGDHADGEMGDGGTDPTDAWEESRLESLAAFKGCDLDAQVELSQGSRSVLDVLVERVTELTVHSWDLARGIGADETLDDELVGAVWAHWWPRREVLARQAGLLEPALDPPLDADLQTRLLALFGREA